MNKLTAVWIHIGISLAIFMVVLYFIVFHWYPLPYFTADGGWQGIRLMLFVDVVLGPFLTLIIYKPNKPHLKLDMSLIACVQAAALVWGCWTVYSQRTVLVVFVDDSFQTLNPDQVIKAGLTLEELPRFSNDSPPLAFLRLPEEKKERREFLADLEVKKGVLAIRLGDRYEPMDRKNLDTVLSRGMSTEELGYYDSTFKTYLSDLLRRYGGKEEDFSFVPIHCRYKHGILVFHKPRGELLEMPDIYITPIY